MMEDCPERTLVSEISPSEMPEKSNLQAAVSAVASVPMLSQLDYMSRSRCDEFPLADAAAPHS
jgi:hypothetical protein